MPTETPPVSELQCKRWREAYRSDISPYEIATESGVGRGIVVDHITGECQHGGEFDGVLSGYAVSPEECTDLRLQYDSGSTIEEVLERSGRRWGTVVRHLTGNCSHGGSGDAPTVTKETVLRRDTVSEEDCEQFRRGVRDAGSVMEFANSVDTDYQVVLAHVNGECTHETTVPPREPNDRRTDVSASECRSIRQSFRADPETQFSDLADEYGCSEQTIERHVRFLCSHSPTDALVTDVEGVEDILAEKTDADRQRKLPPTELARLDSVTNGDPKEASQDLATPEPNRIETTRSRIVRNTDLAHDVKSMYDYTCQVCGDQRRGPSGRPYAEAHHLRPLGKPHDGPDIPGNILVLCPNHHADFDYGRLTVAPKTHRISHEYDAEVDGTELTVETAHDIEQIHLRYHNEVVAGDT